jgi:hypothetical protein
MSTITVGVEVDALVLRGLPLLHDEVSAGPRDAGAQVDVATPVLHPREHDVLRQDRQQCRLVGCVEDASSPS